MSDDCMINYVDYCAACGTEHAFMGGPCQKCGGILFQRDPLSLTDSLTEEDRKFVENIPVTHDEETSCERTPVHQDSKDGKWYFWDETWANRLGPYDSYKEASDACNKYAEQL